MPTQDTVTAPPTTPEPGSTARALAAKVDAAMAEEAETGIPQRVVSLHDDEPVVEVKAEKQEDAKVENEVEEPKAEKEEDADPLTKREQAIKERRLKLEEERLALEEEELNEKKSKRKPKEADEDSDEAWEAKLKAELDADEDLNDSALLRRKEERDRRYARAQEKRIAALEKQLQAQQQKEYAASVEKEFAELADKHTIPESKRGRLVELLARLTKEEGSKSWQELMEELAPAFSNFPEAEPKAGKPAPMRSSNSAKNDRPIPSASARRNGDVPKAPLGREGLVALAESLVEN